MALTDTLSWTLFLNFQSTCVLWDTNMEHANTVLKPLQGYHTWDGHITFHGNDDPGEHALTLLHPLLHQGVSNSMALTALLAHNNATNPFEGYLSATMAHHFHGDHPMFYAPMLCSFAPA
jgi:hypothetical protein